MSNSDTTHPPYVWQRGELMAELLLQEFEPSYIAKASGQDFHFDFLVGIENYHGGTNFFAVKVKVTESPIQSEYSMVQQQFTRFAHSNIPLLLLVIDVKQNQYCYAWLTELTHLNGEQSRVNVPLMQLDEAGKLQLRQRLIEANIVLANYH